MDSNSYGPDRYGSVATVPFENSIILMDHLNGFNKTYENILLNKLNKLQKNNKILVTTEYIFNDLIKSKYNNLCFKFSSKLVDDNDFKHFKEYNIHPEINFKNFVCSFNGSDHVSKTTINRDFE